MFVFHLQGLILGSKILMLRPCLDRPIFVLSLDFLRNQCELFVWVENFETQILKHQKQTKNWESEIRSFRKPKNLKLKKKNKNQPIQTRPKLSLQIGVFFFFLINKQGKRLQGRLGYFDLPVFGYDFFLFLLL